MANWDSTSGAGTLSLHVIEYSQNVAGNFTTVYYELRLYCYNGLSNNYNPTFWEVNVNGNVANGSYTFDFSGYSMKLISSGFFDIPHNADGTKTIAVTGHTNNTGASAIGGPIGVSGALTLTTIPRATQPSVSPTSGATGSSFTITHNPASGSFFHDVAYSLNGGSSYTNIATSVPGSTTTTGWTPAHTLLPNSTSATAIIRVITRQSAGGTIIGTRTVNLPLTVPASIKPTISGVTWDDVQTSAPNIPSLMGAAGRFVQGWSRLRPTVSSAGAGGSTVTSTGIVQAGQSTTSGVAFGAAVNQSGNVAFSASVGDSRGRASNPYNGTVPVTAYNYPNLPTPSVVRTSDAAGNIPSPTGTYLAITPAASVSSLMFAASQKNLLEWQVRIKPSGGSYTTVQAWTAASVSSGIIWASKFVPTGSYAASTEWIVEVSIRDLFGKNGFRTGQTVVTREILVPTEQVFMDWDRNLGIGIGKYRSQGALDVNGDIYHRDGQKLGQTIRELTDWNNATQTGVYDGQNNLNAPIAGWLFVRVSEYGGSSLHCEQIASTFATANSPERMWRRLQLGTLGNWTPWVEVGGVATGTIAMFPTINIPGGWTYCNGSSLATASYPALFAVIGYTYGGSGANFNVPNYRGRVPISVDPSDSDFSTIGQTGGTKTVSLTAAQNGTHSHVARWRYNGSGPDGARIDVSRSGGSGWTEGTAGDNTMIAQSGTGAAHNNVQPYITAYFIIKT